MKRGEIYLYLANFPFGDVAGMKLRPVLLLSEEVGNGEVIVAYISSVIPPAGLKSDILIDPSLPEFQSTNLKVASVLRLHKLATIHRRSIARRLGSFPPQFNSEISSRLRTLLNW